MDVSRIREHLNEAMADYKPPETGSSPSLNDLYSSVLESSIDCGFDADEVKTIWRTGSQAYSVDEISMAFESVFKDVQSASIFYASYVVDALPLPIDVLEGPGSVAIRTLASLKVQQDAKEPAYVIDTGLSELFLNRMPAPWVNFTYALLDKLVKDELLTGSFRCKLFARDLGL